MPAHISARTSARAPRRRYAARMLTAGVLAAAAVTATALPAAAQGPDALGANLPVLSDLLTLVGGKG